MGRMQNDQPNPAGEGRTQKRSPEVKAALANRLSRMAGQILGIRGMVERDAHCADIVVQCQAAASAIASLERELIADYASGEFARSIRMEDPQAVPEFMWTLRRILH